MRLFQAHDALLTDQPGQDFGRIDGRGNKLHVRPTIRHTRQGIRRAHQLFVALDVGVAHRASPLGAQIVGHGQVEHGVDDVLAFLLGNLLHGHALVLEFEFGIANLTCNKLVKITKDDIHGFHAALVVVLTHFLAQFRLRQFGFTLFDRSKRGFLPGRNAIEQVPVFQGHADRSPSSDALSEHPSAAFVRFIDPIQLGLMRLGMLITN